jgi:hypothetical protein
MTTTTTTSTTITPDDALERTEVVLRDRGFIKLTRLNPEVTGIYAVAGYHQQKKLTTVAVVVGSTGAAFAAIMKLLNTRLLFLHTPNKTVVGEVHDWRHTDKGWKCRVYKLTAKDFLITNHYHPHTSCK